MYAFTWSSPVAHCDDIQGGVTDPYVIGLDDALEGLMPKAEFLKKATPHSTLHVHQRLPRHIADTANITLTETDYERIMGTNDLVGIEYLDQGKLAAAAVARLLVRDPDTGKSSYATGFMVSPRLLLTNRHVLKNADVARASLAEFGYEFDATGMSKDTEVRIQSVHSRKHEMEWISCL